MDQEDCVSRMDTCHNLDDWLADDSSGELAREIERNPSLKQLMSRLQSLDARIAEALNDVPVPTGLVDRILARLNAEAMPHKAIAEVRACDKRTGIASGELPATSGRPGPDLAVAAMPGNDNDHAMPSDLPVQPAVLVRRTWSSRRNWLTAAAMAIAASIAFAAFWMRPGTADLSPDSIAGLARELFHAGDAEGELIGAVPPPAGYPLSTQVVASGDARWQKLAGFLGRGGIVYKLHRGQVRAALYVIKLAGGPGKSKIDTSHLFTAPRPSSTEGLTTAVWREQALLYVLVVEGNEADYRQFLAAGSVVG